MPLIPLLTDLSLTNRVNIIYCTESNTCYTQETTDVLIISTTYIHAYLLILLVRTPCRMLKGQTSPTGVHLKATHKLNI